MIVSHFISGFGWTLSHLICTPDTTQVHPKGSGGDGASVWQAEEGQAEADVLLDLKSEVIFTFLSLNLGDVLLDFQSETVLKFLNWNLGDVLLDLRSWISPIDFLSDHAIEGSNWRVTRFKASQPPRGSNLISSNSQELPHKTQADTSWGAFHQDYSACHFKSATIAGVW